MLFFFFPIQAHHSLSPSRSKDRFRVEHQTRNIYQSELWRLIIRLLMAAVTGVKWEVTVSIVCIPHLITNFFMDFIRARDENTILISDSNFLEN